MKPLILHDARAMLIIARVELERLFYSKRGWVSLAAFAFFWYLILSKVILKASENLERISSLSGSVIVEMFAIYHKVALFVLPFMCLFVAANQTGSDRERGTLRFISLRASRDAIYFGRFLGQVAIIYLLVFSTLISITILVILKEIGFVDVVLLETIKIGFSLFCVILPFVAMMAVFSVLFQSPRQATLLALLFWAVLSMMISKLINEYPGLEAIRYIVPGSQFEELREVNSVDYIQFAYIPLLQSAVYLLIGRFIMRGSAL